MQCCSGALFIPTADISPLHRRMVAEIKKFYVKFGDAFRKDGISPFGFSSRKFRPNVTTGGGLFLPTEGCLAKLNRFRGARVIMEVEYHHHLITGLHEHMCSWMKKALSIPSGSRNKNKAKQKRYSSNQCDCDGVLSKYSKPVQSKN